MWWFFSKHNQMGNSVPYNWRMCNFQICKITRPKLLRLVFRAKDLLVGMIKHF